MPDPTFVVFQTVVCFHPDSLCLLICLRWYRFRSFCPHKRLFGLFVHTNIVFFYTSPMIRLRNSLPMPFSGCKAFVFLPSGPFVFFLFSWRPLLTSCPICLFISRFFQIWSFFHPEKSSEKRLLSEEAFHGFIWDIICTVLFPSSDARVSGPKSFPLISE